MAFGKASEFPHTASLCCDVFERSRHEGFLPPYPLLTFRNFGLSRPPANRGGAEGGANRRSRQGGRERRLATDFRQADEERIATESERGRAKAGQKEKILAQPRFALKKGGRAERTPRREQN